MYIVLIIIKQRVLDVNKGGLSSGDIVVRIGAYDQETSYEAWSLALGQ